MIIALGIIGYLLVCVLFSRVVDHFSKLVDNEDRIAVGAVSLVWPGVLVLGFFVGLFWFIGGGGRIRARRR